MARRGEPRIEPLAAAVQRLAVLLAAGVTPSSSWHYLAEAAHGPLAPALTAIDGAVAAGAPVAESVLAATATASPDEATAWRGLAAAWAVATEAGASLAPTLREFSVSLRALGQNQRDLATALAGPRATARLVMALPAVGVLFGVALGFDPLGVLFTTAPGAVCLLLGVALMVAAQLWNRRLLAGARPRSLTPGVELDLLAIAVSGGGSLPRALGIVAEVRERCGLPDDRSAAIDEVLDLSRRAGVPAAALLRAEADEARRRARSEGERRAAALAITLMLPLGACVLPAFMLLGVAPLLVSVISSTVTAF